MAFNSVTLNMTITNPAGGAGYTPFAPGNFALRDYPIHRLFNSVSLTLGSSTLSIPLNDVLDVYRTCSFDHDDYYNMGSFGGIRDSMAGVFSQLGASNMSSIGQWTSGVQNHVEGRGMMNIEQVQVLVGGAYVPLTTANNTIAAGASAQYRVQFSVVEPVLLPIFSHILKAGLSLTHLSQFQISFILADPTSIVCAALPNGATAQIAWDTTYGLSQNNVNLFLKWITPPPGSDYGDIVRPMYDLQRYITTAQQAPGIAPSIAYNANLGTQITSQTISLPVIPSKLIFAVKIPRSIRYGDSNFVRYQDSFLPITNIRVTLGNRSINKWIEKHHADYLCLNNQKNRLTVGRVSKLNNCRC